MSSANFVIRRAVIGDAAALAVFAARTFEETFGPHNTAADMTAYLTETYGVRQQTKEIEDAAIVTLLVESEHELIGFAQLRVLGSSIEIARFYVDRGWHGRGVSQALMAVALNTALSIGANRVWLGVWEKNARAIAFYAKCGFRDIGSQPFWLGSDLQTDRVMELLLPF
ncbi:MAG: GNAT family N-acetyltransferase [Thermoanaerobaculia bacterium]